MDPFERHVALEGAFNFRDAGGYTGAGGAVVRRGILWRSDGLSRLTDADRRRLAVIGLRTVIDLRTEAELGDHGRVEWPDGGFDYHNLPLLDVLPSAEHYSQTWRTPEHVAEQYLDMLDDGHHAVGRALDLLADPARYPLVVHCAAGKDRTGITVAAALGMVGVVDEDIVADYALSGAAMERMYQWLLVERPEQAERWKTSAAAMVSAVPETMRCFVAGIHDRYGSWEGLAAHLGRPDLPAALRAALLDAG